MISRFFSLHSPHFNNRRLSEVWYHQQPVCARLQIQTLRWLIVRFPVEISHACENLKYFQRGNWSSLTDVTQMHLGREKNCPQLQKMGNLFSRSPHTLTQIEWKSAKKYEQLNFQGFFFPTEHNFFQILFFPIAHSRLTPISPFTWLLFRPQSAATDREPQTREKTYIRADFGGGDCR